MKYFELYDGQSHETSVEQPQWSRCYDIIVAGAGSGGIYSSLAAAKEGKKVLLIEKSQWCGGMHIQGLVNGYYYGFRTGLFEQTDVKSKELAKNVFYDLSDAKRIVVGESLKEEGVDIAVNSIIIGIYAEGQNIVGIKACLEHEIVDIKCCMLVDATSEGHVLRLLPLNFHKGRGTDQAMQPFSSVRSVCFDKKDYDGGISVPAGSAADAFLVSHTYRDNGYIDQYDEEDYTAGILRANASHLDILTPETRFLYIAPLMGVREGVLFEGEQNITLKEVLEQKDVPENILLYCFSDIDKHGSDLAFDEKIYQEWWVHCNMSTCVVYLPIPVGSTVPKGWKGLLSTGRCLSMDGYTNSAIRMNTDVFRIGEACGVLASMAVDYDQDPMKVPYADLMNRLKENNFFNEENPLKPSFWTKERGNDRKFIDWLTEPEQIAAELSTNTPAIALWSCRLLGKEVIGDAVYEMTKSEDEMLRYNAAIALGVMEDERALPLLREIIKNRKPFYFMDCRRSNQMRSVIAICLCGQMKDTGIVDELLTIIQPEEYEKPMYHELLEPCYKLSITKEQNSVYYQHFSHAVAALVKIAQAHEEYRDTIKNALYNALDDETYIKRITLEPEYNAYYLGALECKEYFMKHLMN